MLRWVAWGGWLSLLVSDNPLVRRQAPRALGRFWMWQAWRRLPNRSVELVFPEGTTMLLPGWSLLAGIVTATGSHEPAEQTFVHRLLRAGDGAIDVGANLGLYAARLAAEGVYVSTFEPNDRARGMLEDNLARNAPVAQWRSFSVALDDHESSAFMTSDLESSNHILRGEPYDGTATEVEVRQLDRVVAEDKAWWDAHAVVFMKIDAEGRDAGVLRGGKQMLAEHRPVVLVETWAGDDEVRAVLSDLGYRYYRYDLDRSELIEFPAEWDGQANLIAIPASRMEFVRQRLASSRRCALRPPAVRWMREVPAAADGVQHTRAR